MLFALESIQPQVQMRWQYAIYRGFCPKLPLTIPGAHDVHFSNRLQPRDQHAATDIRALPVSSRAPRALFFTSWPGTHAHCHIYLTHVCLCFSRQILFTLGVWLFHVQVLAPTSLHITPSGIFSALACRLSHYIAFTS
jgi:hypothetical protein